MRIIAGFISTCPKLSHFSPYTAAGSLLYKCKGGVYTGDKVFVKSCVQYVIEINQLQMTKTYKDQDSRPNKFLSLKLTNRKYSMAK